MGEKCTKCAGSGMVTLQSCLDGPSTANGELTPSGQSLTGKPEKTTQGNDARRVTQGNDARRVTQGNDPRRVTQGNDARRVTQGNGHGHPRQSQMHGGY